MPPVKFFGFTNPATYLFFQWVHSGGGHNPATLVTAAMDAVDGEEFFEIDGDVSSAARDALAKMLGAIVDDLRTGAECDDLDPAAGPEPEWLTRALLAEALGQIDCWAVAVALMIDAGKWNPDDSIPEAE